MKRGHPVRGLIGGFILGILLVIDLVFGGVVNLNSAVVTVLPLVMLIAGLLLGLWAPIGRKIPEPVPPRNFARPSAELAGGSAVPKEPPPI